MTALAGELLRGRAWVFGDDVDTDVIIPARRCTTIDPAELGLYAMEGLDAGFAASMRRGDMVVGGCNFGCGSSRETAPLALLGAGVGAVVAKSFSRIFYRNAINVGLPIFESMEACDEVRQGDWLAADVSGGRLVNETLGKSYPTVPYPDVVREIVACGGMVEYVRKRLGKLP
jgi:3-isopropylmalate dehydratase small subunit